MWKRRTAGGKEARSRVGVGGDSAGRDERNHKHGGNNLYPRETKPAEGIASSSYHTAGIRISITSREPDSEIDRMLEVALVSSPRCKKTSALEPPKSTKGTHPSIRFDIIHEIRVFNPDEIPTWVHHYLPAIPVILKVQVLCFATADYKYYRSTFMN